MSPITSLPPLAPRLGDITPAIARVPSAGTPGAWRSAWGNIRAIAGVVIMELYRRKDFYVLFIVTILICLIMASVNIFHDDKIVRYLKEISLLLIWISTLVMAITTTAPPTARPSRFRLA